MKSPCPAVFAGSKTSFVAKYVLAASAVVFLAACAGSGKDVTGGVGGNFENVTLRPGDSVSCVYSPCRVFFELPAGAGMHTVTVNKQNVGTYPAGKTVLLGSFYPGVYVIRVVDTIEPLAYLGVDHE